MTPSACGAGSASGAADTAVAFALFAEEIAEGADAARIEEIARRYALEFVGPPLG